MTSLRSALLLLVLVAQGSPLRAQSTGSIEMSVERDTVRVGAPFILRIRVEATNADIGEIVMPELAAFRQAGERVSHPFHLSFGTSRGAHTTQSSTVKSVTLVPLQAGTVHIDPARVTIGGREYRSGRVTLRVLESNTPPGLQPGAVPQVTGANNSGAPANGALDGATYDPDAFIRTYVDKSEAFLGEQVTVSVFLYTRYSIRGSNLGLKREPTADGFWTQDLLDRNQPPPIRQQTVEGRRFNVVTLRRFAAFPVREGACIIGSPAIEFAIGGFFQRRSVERSGVPVTVTAKPLPDSSRRGAVVGKFAISAALDRPQVPTGDAVTLTLTVEGTGNVRDVRLESPVIDGIQVLTPETRDNIRVDGNHVRGTRIYEWLLVPERPGQFEIPAIGFDQFEPSRGRYMRVESERLRLTAAGNAIAPADPAPSGNTPTTASTATSPSASASAEVAAGAFGPLRTESSLLRQSNPVSSSAWYPYALLAPPFLFLGLFAFGRTKRVLADRSEASAGTRTLKAADKRVAGGLKKLESGDIKGFSSDVSEGLREALRAKLDAPIGGMTHREVRVLLVERGAPKELATEVESVLEELEAARYSTSGAESGSLRELGANVKRMLTKLSSLSLGEDA